MAVNINLKLLSRHTYLDVWHFITNLLLRMEPSISSVHFPFFLKIWRQRLPCYCSKGPWDTTLSYAEASVQSKRNFLVSHRSLNLRKFGYNKLEDQGLIKTNRFSSSKNTIHTFCAAYHNVFSNLGLFDLFDWVHSTYEVLLKGKSLL